MQRQRFAESITVRFARRMGYDSFAINHARAVHDCFLHRGNCTPDPSCQKVGHRRDGNRREPARAGLERGRHYDYSHVSHMQSIR